MDQFYQFFLQSTSISFHHPGTLDRKLEAIYQDLWGKAISLVILVNLMLISTKMCL
jgi:hypothetical protein